MEQFLSGNYVVMGMKFIYKQGEDFRQVVLLSRREWPVPVLDARSDLLTVWSGFAIELSMLASSSLRMRSPLAMGGSRLLCASHASCLFCMCLARLSASRGMYQSVMLSWVVLQVAAVLRCPVHTAAGVLIPSKHTRMWACAGLGMACRVCYVPTSSLTGPTLLICPRHAVFGSCHERSRVIGCIRTRPVVQPDTQAT